jgi:ferredoxin
MRVVVDLNRMRGQGTVHGRGPPRCSSCTDDDELIVLQEHPDESVRGRVEEAVRQCPRQAISIEEDA